MNIEQEQHDLRAISKENTHEYEIYIKSHDERHDYEDYCQAQNLDEASEIFCSRINRMLANIDYENDRVYYADWSPAGLLPFINKVEN